MNRHPPEVDAGLAAWLDEGPSRGPEKVLTNALARVRSTRQDRVWLDRFPQPTRFQAMSTMITLGAIAALAFAVSIGVDPHEGEVAAPAPSASAAPSDGGAQPSRLYQGTLAAGDWTVAPFGGADWAPCGPTEDPCPEATVDDDIRFTFTVPAGWAGAPFGSDIWLSAEHNSGPHGAGFLIGRGGWLWSDPCAETGEPDIPVGPSVDEFVNALVAHPLLDLSDPVEVTLGGYPARYMELQGPADRTDCMYFAAWDPTFYAQGDSNLQHIWVVDVDGVRVVIHGSEFPGTDPQRSAELRAIVESMRIEHDPALAPSPSPQPSPGVKDTASVVHGWPSTRPDGDPAGLYSWTPDQAERDWMHKIVGSTSVEITFQTLEDGTVYDLGYLYRSPLDAAFGRSPEPLEAGRVQTWIMDVDGSQVAFIVTSFPDTPAALIAEAETVVSSIRAEPIDTEAGYRLVFELQDGWDSG
jgi:hypothetical protein